MEENTVEGLRNLLNNTHDDNPANMVRDILQNEGTGKDLYFIAGAEDILAKSDEVQKLAAIGNYPYSVIQDCGHAVLVEKPIEWREKVIEYLCD